MRKTIFILLFTSIVLGAGEPAKFVWLGVGAKSKSMGGTGGAYSENPFGAFFNPALLSMRTGNTASVGMQLLSLDRKIYYATFATRIKGDAGLGITWLHGSVDKVEARDKDGILTGTIANGNDEIFFAFGKPLYGPVHFGIGVQYCQSSIENVSTYTAGLQFGLRSDFTLGGNDKKLRLITGISAQNFLMNYRWNSGAYYGQGHTSEENFPIFLRGAIALSGKLGLPLLIAFDCWQNTPGKIKWGAGIDAKIITLTTNNNSILNELSARSGISYNSFSLGTGINGKIAIPFSIDYGIVVASSDPAIQHILDLRIDY